MAAQVSAVAVDGPGIAISAQLWGTQVEGANMTFTLSKMWLASSCSYRIALDVCEGNRAVWIDNKYVGFCVCVCVHAT